MSPEKSVPARTVSEKAAALRGSPSGRTLAEQVVPERTALEKPLTLVDRTSGEPGHRTVPESSSWAKPPLSAPATRLETSGSAENMTVWMRDWSSADGERSQESAHERVLKRLSNPMESISSYTHSISKMIASSPKSLADFSAGIFVRGAEDSQQKEPLLLTEEKEEHQKEEHQKQSPHADNANVWLKNMVEEKPELFAALESKFGDLGTTSDINSSRMSDYLATDVRMQKTGFEVVTLKAS